MFIGTAEFREAVVHFNDVSIDSSSSIFIESMSFDKFVISHLKLKDLFFNRSFNIEKVLLSGPTIHFLKDTTISRKDIFSKILTPNVVSTKSKSAPFGFEIGELEIAQGSFQLEEAQKTDFGIGRLNLKLTGIGMDDLKVLNGSAPDLGANFDIQLGIYDIHKDLEGETELQIDSVVYKKDLRLIETGGIQLKKLTTSSDYSESEISIFTKLISLHGFSLSHLLSSKDAKFDRLTISNTNIFETLEYFDEIKVKDTTSATKGRLFSNMVQAFITDTLEIENFDYRSKNKATDSVDYINNLNIWLYSVRVDSNFILYKEYLRPIEKSFLSSGPIKMHVPEGGFDFACDTLSYSGPGKQQKVGNFHLKSYPSLFSINNSQQIIQFNSDSLVISDLDEREWMDSSIVEISVYMKNPQVTGSNVIFGGSKSNKSKPPAFSANKIILNKLNLENGNINIEGASNERINTELINIEIDDLAINLGKGQNNHTVNWENLYTSIENSSVFISEKLLIELDKGVIDNKNLDFEGLLYSENPNIKSYQSIADLEIDSKRFGAERIQLENFDMQAFINRKYLTIDNLSISKPRYFQFTGLKVDKNNSNADTDTVATSPTLLYRKINKMLTGYVNYLNVKSFSINDANVLYQMQPDNLKFQSRISSNMMNIKFDKDLPEGELPELTIDEYEFCITEVDLHSDKISFDTESVCYNSPEDILTFTNSHADNLIRKKENAGIELMEFNVTFPKIKLTNPDFSPLGGGPLSFNIIHIVDPDIFIQFPPPKEEHEKTKASGLKILPFTFLEDGVKLENGKVDICLAGKTDSTTINVNQIDLDAQEMHKIVGAFVNPSDNNNLFGYVDFHLKDISLKGPKMNLDIRNIDYDKQSGVIAINPVKYEMITKSRGPESISLTSSVDIPEIKIEYPDVMLVDEKVESFGATNILIPTVDFLYESDKLQKPTENQDTKIAVNDSSLRNFLGNIKFFHIDSTVINHIGITHHDVSDSTEGSFEIKRVSLLVDKLKIDSSHFDFHEKRIAKDINIQLHDKELVTADSMYRMKINNITYYYSRDKIVVDSFEVIPMYERELFFEKAGLQTDRMQVKFNSAVADGVDLLSIIESKKLQVNKLTLDKLHLMDHRDQHYPRKENDFKKLPKESLFSLPFVLNVDTMKINNSFFLYGEYVDKSPEPGEIYFTNFDASLYNISNVISPENRNDSLYAHITADIMNLSPMTLDLTIPLLKEDDNFWIKADVEKVDLREFNSMTENLFGISVLRGSGSVKIPMMNFNEINATGSVIFEYKKLKLAMYNRNKAKLNRGLGSGLIDFMLNGVLIKSNNPNFLGKTRTGFVYAERNNQRSIFNFLWKGTMSGLMSTMGFNNKDQRVEKKELKVEEKIERKDERQLNKLNK